MTHHVAVQKDVTLVHKQSTPPIDWTSAEVALWLDEFADLHPLSLAFAEAGVDGRRLLMMDGQGMWLVIVVVVVVVVCLLARFIVCLCVCVCVCVCVLQLPAPSMCPAR